MKDAVNKMKRGVFYRYLIAPVVSLMTQGITPEKIALSLAFGIGLGVFPVLGSTSFLCAAAAMAFELNLPAIQLVNWLIYPLQLILLVPFLRAGARLFRVAPLPLSVAQMLALARSSFTHAIATLWLAGVHAICVWLLVGPLAILLLYFGFASALRYLAASSGLRAQVSGHIVEGAS